MKKAFSSQYTLYKLILTICESQVYTCSGRCSSTWQDVLHVVHFIVNTWNNIPGSLVNTSLWYITLYYITLWLTVIYRDHSRRSNIEGHWQKHWQIDHPHQYMYTWPQLSTRKQCCISNVPRVNSGSLLLKLSLLGVAMLSHQWSLKAASCHGEPQWSP